MFYIVHLTSKLKYFGPFHVYVVLLFHWLMLIRDLESISNNKYLITLLNM